MRMRFGVLLSAATIGLIASGQAADPMLVPQAIAAGSLASQEKPNTNSDWLWDSGSLSPPGYSSSIPEAFYRSVDGDGCQVEEQRTPHGWREVTICD